MGQLSKPIHTRTADLLLALLIVLLPLPRHWVLLRRTYPGVYYEQTSLALYPSDFIVGALLLLAGLALARRGRGILPALRSPLFRGLALLVGLCAASLLWAFDPLLALFFTGRLLLLLALVAALLLLRPGARGLQTGLALLLATQSAAAIAQFVLQDNLGLRFLGEIDLNRYPGGGSLVLLGDSYWLRAYGLTAHPNILGGVLAVTLLLSAACFLRSRGAARLVWAVLLLAGGVALLLSYSRAAWLGAAAGGLALGAAVLLQPAARRVYARPLLALGAAGLLLLALVGWQQRVLIATRLNPGSSSTEQRSLSERQALNAAALRLLRQAPVTGVGTGNFPVAVLPLVGDLPQVGAQPVHNVPLLVTVELGPAGGALWLLLTLGPLLQAIHAWRRKELTLLGAGLAAALLALAVADLFDHYSWSWQQGRLLRWLLWSGWLLSTTLPLFSAGATKLPVETPNSRSVG